MKINKTSLIRYLAIGVLLIPLYFAAKDLRAQIHKENLESQKKSLETLTKNTIPIIPEKKLVGVEYDLENQKPEEINYESTSSLYSK
jgi:hypothetical protein